MISKIFGDVLLRMSEQLMPQYALNFLVYAVAWIWFQYLIFAYCWGTRSGGALIIESNKRLVIYFIINISVLTILFVLSWSGF
jgi:hypothetical protein